MQRLKRWAYVMLVGVLSSFFVGMFVVMMIETAGPTETVDGRVIERNEGTRDVTRCGTSAAGRCRTVTYPTYAVVGERADGSTWIAVGEGAYDAMRGESGIIRVSTSTITNRVVALDGNDTRDADWSVSGSGFVWFSIGAVVIWVPLVVAYEWRRRTGFFDLGSFDRLDLLIGVVAFVVGMLGLWWVLFSKTAGLDVASSADLYGDFLQDPIAFVAQERNDEPGVQVGEFVDAGRNGEYATVPLAELSSSVNTDVGDGVVAVPVLQVADSGLGRFDFVEWSLVAADESRVETTSCPSNLLSFPSQLGVDPSINGGFVCFDADPIAKIMLELEAGSGVYADITRFDAEALSPD